MQSIIESAWENRDLLNESTTIKAIETVIEQLDKGLLRVAEPTSDGSWIVNEWVKKAVILYFHYFEHKDTLIDEIMSFSYFSSLKITIR